MTKGINPNNPDYEKLSKIAWPIECWAAHVDNEPRCILIGEQESGIYIYEYYRDDNGRYWFKEYVRTQEGKRVPFDEYVWGPIREKAKRNRMLQEAAMTPEQKEQKQNDLAALHKRLTVGKIQKY